MRDPLLDTGELELRDYLSVLRRRKLTIVLTTLAILGLTLAWSFLQTPKYRATAEVLLDDGSSQQYLNPDQPARSAADRLAQVQTETRVMRSRSVRIAVAQALGRTPDVDIDAIDDTSIVAIRAIDTDPARAAEEANVFATTYIELRQEARAADLSAAIEVLETQIDDVDRQLADFDAYLAGLDGRIANAASDDERQAAEAERAAAAEDFASLRSTLQTQRSGYVEQLGALQIAENSARGRGGEVVSEAIEPRSPFSPDPVRNAGFALVGGLVLGCVLAFLREYLDDTLRSKDDLDLATGRLEVVGLIPQVETWKNRAVPQVVSLTQPNSPPAESYRALRTSLQFMGIDRPTRIVQLTSSAAAEGKTTTLANLGVALARAGHRVILVDCDLRRPRLHQFFGLDNTVGLSTTILGDQGIEAAVQQVPDVPRLALMASGPPPPNPSELLSTTRAERILKDLADHADYVLLDCPPLLPVADAVVLAQLVDATVLVATVNSTTKRSLRRALELLRQVDAPLVGAVLNGLKAESAYAYSYGEGGYAYAYAHPEERSGWLPGRRRKANGGVSPEEAMAAPLPEVLEEEPVEQGR